MTPSAGRAWIPRIPVKIGLLVTESVGDAVVGRVLARAEAGVDGLGERRRAHHHLGGAADGQPLGRRPADGQRGVEHQDVGVDQHVALGRLLADRRGVGGIVVGVAVEEGRLDLPRVGVGLGPEGAGAVDTGGDGEPLEDLLAHREERRDPRVVAVVHHVAHRLPGGVEALVAGVHEHEVPVEEHPGAREAGEARRIEVERRAVRGVGRERAALGQGLGPVVRVLVARGPGETRHRGHGKHHRHPDRPPPHLSPPPRVRAWVTPTPRGS